MLLEDKKLDNKNTQCDGQFIFDVQSGKKYCFIGNADGYKQNKDICASTENVKNGSTVYVKIPLKKDAASINLKVIDKITGLPIAGAQIILSSNCKDTIITKIVNKNGEDCFKVECGCIYTAVTSAAGYVNVNKVINTKTMDCDQLVSCGEEGMKTIDIPLEKITDITVDNNDTGAITIELKNIYYDFDKSFIRKESLNQLNKVLAFMTENPTSIVEISSHTDARASFDYNIGLSQRRAQAVVNWLISKGISTNRMKPVGYGETKPVNNCTDNVKCTEFEHQRNRRTEFKIIGGNINLKSLERLDMNVDPCTNCKF